MSLGDAFEGDLRVTCGQHAVPLRVGHCAFTTSEELVPHRSAHDASVSISVATALGQLKIHEPLADSFTSLLDRFGLPA